MDLIDLSRHTPTDDRFRLFLDDLCDRLEFDHASYATVNPINGDVQGFANYRPEWIEYYTAKGLHRVDPTLHLARQSIAPLDWDRLERNEQFRAVFDEAPGYGVAARGLSIPIRGPYGDTGLLNVTRACSDRDWGTLKTKVIGDLQIAAVHMHDNVMQSDLLMSVLRRPNLSRREVEILQWVAVGKSQQDIGDILSISHRTVEVHLRSGREKLGALTTSQAIGRAIGLRLIQPG